MIVPTYGADGINLPLTLVIFPSFRKKLRFFQLIRHKNLPEIRQASGGQARQKYGGQVAVSCKFIADSCKVMAVSFPVKV